MTRLTQKDQNDRQYRFGFKLKYYTYKKNYDLVIINLLKEIRKKYDIEYIIKKVYYEEWLKYNRKRPIKMSVVAYSAYW